MKNEDILEAGEEGSLVSFNWNIIDECQFKCTYCSATDFNKNDYFAQGLHRKAHELVLHKLSKLTFDFNIDLQGGEPTLHPNLAEIISALEKMEHCKSIVIATNFTAGIPFYRQFDVPNTKVVLHVSYHAEYHKKILNKLVKISKQLEHVRLFIEVILFPKKKYFQQMIDFMRGLEANNIVFGVNLVRENQFWDNTTDDGFVELFKEWTANPKLTPFSKLIKHVTKDGVEFLHENYVLENRINYKGFKCQQMTYFIGLEGNFVNVCTAQKMPLLAREKDFKKIVICPVDGPCPCSQMFHYKKTRS
jgi:organic radical activating enzyme